MFVAIDKLLIVKAHPNDLRQYLARHPRCNGAEVCRALNDINRSTLMRLVGQMSGEVIRRGGTHRARYALRRPLRGRMDSLSVYRIDALGGGHSIGALDLLYPEGSAMSFNEPFRWPLDKGPMQDGWFDGLPYPILDIRPQGFLGRNFAYQSWRDLDVPENLNDWTDDDVLHVLSTRGHDQSGDLILGDLAYERHLAAQRDWERDLVPQSRLAEAYPALAAQALAYGVSGSSAAGEFPKFTAMVDLGGGPLAIIVKFSGAEDSPAVRRWADLLVCEHVALETLPVELSVPSARGNIRQHGGRTFLEVIRFDRQGAHGRLPVCTLASLNGALLGKAGATWPALAAELEKNGWLTQADVARVARSWWFGRLIANTDMHEGNLAFFPGLRLAPVYDMLPMGYAPLRGGEVPSRVYLPPLPLPREEPAWSEAAQAAVTYWGRCEADSRISTEFRQTCRENKHILRKLLD